MTLYGLSDDNRLRERVPTFSFTLQNWQPRQAAEALAQEGINVWDGNYYALAITERLGLEGRGGMVRVGPVYSIGGKRKGYWWDKNRTAASP